VYLGNKMSSDSSKYDNLECILHDQSSKPEVIPLRHLRKITNNFSDERLLGKGGTGDVYKVTLNHVRLVFQIYVTYTDKDVKQGVLQSGEIIAVKRLEPSMVRAQSLFENEVHHLMRLKHPNIVRFMGYCYETKRYYEEYGGKMVFAEKSEMLLCLEYLPKGSLDGYLSGMAILCGHVGTCSVSQSSVLPLRS
jgi:serine/threonine protein kinase